MADLHEQLRRIDAASGDDRWLAESVALLGRAGYLGNTVPRSRGGRELDDRDLLEVYIDVARGSLAAALILTQHDRACELLRDGENPALAEQLLPELSVGRELATVGISQLTTSRRHGPAPLRARRTPGGYALDGVMPWVTSANHADQIVTGAVLEDEQQLLAVVSPRAAAIAPGAPLELAALSATDTSQVQCNDAPVSAEQVIRGPSAQVLASRAPVKGLTVAAVGIGVACGLLDEAQGRAAKLPAAHPRLAQIDERIGALRAELLALAVAGVRSPAGDDGRRQRLRLEVNALVTRLAATMMVLAKGSGFLANSPAQRLAREAMFLLVWSAPVEVQLGTIEQLWD